MRSPKMKARLLLAVIGISVFIGITASVMAEGAVPLTDKDLSSISGPKSDEIAAKGDPGADLTGTVNDITISDSKKGLTVADLANQVGQNKIAINFVWTLVTGFLVMFMQAGFALVETGLIRAKNANHTMMMNFMVYGLGLFAYYVCGFAGGIVYVIAV